MRIVVPFSAGSNTDGQARIIADKLGEIWKQQVIVENRPGIPGTASVAKAAPDGYTIMLTSSGHPVANVINRAAPFDPVKDFAGITQVSTVPATLAVPPELPANNVKEFLALARAKPGSLNFASAGTASTSYLAGEVFKQIAKIDIVHIPHKGAPEAMTSLLRNDSQIYFVSANASGELIEAKKIKAIGDQQRQAVPAAAGRADRRRIRPAGLCLRILVRRDGAGRHAAGDPQQDQRGYRARAADARRRTRGSRTRAWSW